MRFSGSVGDAPGAHSQSGAKRFFAERVIRQANAERMSLSHAERQMLYWSESDPAFQADPQLVEALAAQISDEEYEAKISGQAVDPQLRSAKTWGLWLAGALVIVSCGGVYLFAVSKFLRHFPSREELWLAIWALMVVLGSSYGVFYWIRDRWRASGGVGQ